MARHLIQNAATGETRIVGDAALPFFPGFAIVDTYDDGIPPVVFYGAGEADLRYVNVMELSDPASAASVALRAASDARYASQRIMRPNGNRLGVLGDSLMSYSNSVTTSSNIPTNGATIYKQVELLTRQRVRMTDPMQDPGATIDDVLNVQLPALLARSPIPNATVIAIGRNNVGSGSFDLAAFMDKYKTICNRLAAAGSVPIPHTLMPIGQSGSSSPSILTSRTNALRVNAALRKLAPAWGYPLIDQYGALVDVAGGLLPAYNNDDTHLTRAGYEANVNAIIAQGLPSLFPPAPLVTIKDAAQPADVFAGSGLFTAASPTGWATSGATASFVTPGAGEGIAGRWLRFLKPAGTAADTAYRKTLDGAFIPGHVYEFAGCMKGEGMAVSGASVQIALEWRAATVKTTTDLLLNSWTRDDLVTFYGTYACPAGSDGLRFVFYQKGTPSADASTLISEVVCRDLTAMNLPA